VLDPFMGSGQTALAALKAGRLFVGYDTDDDYVRLADRRIRAFLAENGQHNLFSEKNQVMEG
jgi:DNA modification methylase